MMAHAILRALIMLVSALLLLRLAGVEPWPPLWRWPFAALLGWFMAVGWFDCLDRLFDRWGFLTIPEEDEP